MQIFEQEKLDTLKLLRLLYRNRTYIILSAVLGGILGLVVTSFMPPKFYSYGIIYPSNSVTRNELLENPQFGYEIDADRLMQILESDKIRSRMIEKFGLVEYYNMDTTSLNWGEDLDKKFVKDITFFRSKYMSIVISARMKDPQMAADIVNSIVDIADDVQNEIYQENLTTEFETIQRDYEAKEQLVSLFADSIYRMKSKAGYAQIPLGQFLTGQSGEKGSMVDNPALSKLIGDYYFEYEQLMDLKKRYESAKVFYNRPFPKNYVIDEARPSYRKASPSYTVNGAIGTLGALLFALTVVLFRHRYQALMRQLKAE